MRPAAWPRAAPDRERLLLLEPDRERFEDRAVGDLARLLEPGDVFVVNDAATLPAALPATTARGAALELRVISLDALGGRARALVFGEGSWRTPTERRSLPPLLVPGDALDVGPDLGATIVRVDRGRYVELAFDRRGAPLLRALYAAGRPVQYSYLAGPLALWHVQNRFAARPWAVEMPSAARPLTFETLLALKRRGVGLGWVTHAAGLSSTGSDELDRELPLDERYEIPETTARLIARARAEGGRVVAAGTTVVRALEASAVESGRVEAGSGVASLKISATSKLRAVDSILTGIHEPGTSHFSLLEAFAPRALLERALGHALATHYLGHEFGDSLLILPERRVVGLAA